MLQAPAHRGMLDVAIVRHILHLRVRDAAVVIEERRHAATGDIATLVDGRGEHGPAIFPVPHRIVGPAAEEGDAKGSASDYHSFLSDNGYDRACVSACCGSSCAGVLPGS